MNFINGNFIITDLLKAYDNFSVMLAFHPPDGHIYMRNIVVVLDGEPSI
jgi:hypothetical protein